MSTAVFGGSFNPVHNGHISLAATILKNIPDIARLVVMPAAVSPFKQQSKINADGSHRLNMCRLAFKDIPGAEVSDYEISKGGVSYTYETLEYLSELYRGERLYLVIGSDSLKSLPGWKNFHRIMELCTPAAAARSKPDRQLIAEYEKAVRPYGDVLVFDAEPFEISSTELRKIIADGGDYSRYMPYEAAEYIKRFDLYKV